MASRVVVLPGDLSVVFPYNPAIRSYERSFYSSFMTNERASFDEVNEVLTRIENLSHPFLQKNAVASCALIIFVLIWFCSYVAVLALLSNKNGILTIILVAGFWVVFFIVVFLAYRLRSTQQKQIRRLAQEVLGNYNPTFIERGVRWYLPETFPETIELWKEYMTQKFDQAYELPSIHQPFIAYRT